MPSYSWQFFIDVGGTFTDVVARAPDGRLITYKLLSSGGVRGVVEPGSTSACIQDGRRIGDPTDFWIGYRMTLLGTDEPCRADGHADCAVAVDLAADAAVSAPAVMTGGATARITGFNSDTGCLLVDPPIDSAALQGRAYELYGDEEAPVLAIRYLMGLGLDDPIGAVDVRLGTTRATNALLERKGARVALVTTKGFADILKIGNQDRPRLFELNIRKRDELTTSVIEIDERLSATGEVLRAPDESVVRRQLEALKASRIEAPAICLLHAHVNPVHEDVVARIAEAVGFSHLSVSSRVARLERIVPRGDTTVVDAYLAPVVRGYVESIRRSMPEATLRLMTSSGGLVDAAAAPGKETILSGPAGGVVGCRHVAYQAGMGKTIGFDMGGTSTDVSRIEEPPHEFEYSYETVKAGVRIMTPMLAVETVASGGGSICEFDGQKLTVGPESAGADPGPACYGRGGPLTVTDMNLLLGRVVPEYFPFRLDRATVDRKSSALCDRIHAATGSSVGPIELAEGFIKIANANMAFAIKRVSLAKGYDVREYALTTFGGAGAQHACAIARMLGMSRVLCSPFAGVLSAVGIGVADVKRIGQRSVHEPLDDRAGVVLEPVFTSIADELRRAMTDEGIDARTLAPAARTMDLCYAGQATLITVPSSDTEVARDLFEAMHRQLYGYVHEGRGIEVRVVRVELTARSEHLSTREPDVNLRQPSARPRTTSMVVDGRCLPVPLYVRRELDVGKSLDGPAIVIEDTSTIVVDSGWEATVIDTGDIVLTGSRAASTHEVVSAEVDPIQLELFNNQFASVAQQMGTTLRRTALSVNVKERLDFSCAVFTPQGDLVVNAPHIPVHLGGMSDCIKMLREDVGVFSPDDVYVTNDPYRGGSHLNDVTVVTPVHDGGGRLLFVVASRAHHAEIGGTRPGSMPADSTSLSEEGVVIRAFRWIEKGKPQHESLRRLLAGGGDGECGVPYPSRMPDENLADIAAQAAANQTGVRELKAMVERYGVDVVHAYMRHIQSAAERQMRESLRQRPDGVYRFEDRLDCGSAISLAITISGDRATLDFTGTDPVLPGNLNANRAIVTSAVLYCLRCLIAKDIPLNAGVLSPIELILPTCFLDPPSSADPRDCPAVAGGNVETSQRIVDCVFGALGTVSASQGTMNNLSMGNDRFGYYETICGGAGAGSGFDGADAVHTHMTNTRLTDPEVLETRVPVRLVRFAIRQGSGGRGRHCGGCGVVREMEFLEPLDVSILSQRRTTAPYGLNGGESGQSGRNLLRRAGLDVDEVLPPVARVAVFPGDRLTIETPGGGGWGREE